MKTCSNCGRRLYNGETYIRGNYGDILCSDCYTKTPYTAYLYEYPSGDFIGTSDEITEEEDWEKDNDRPEDEECEPE